MIYEIDDGLTNSIVCNLINRKKEFIQINKVLKITRTLTRIRRHSYRNVCLFKGNA